MIAALTLAAEQVLGVGLLGFAAGVLAGGLR